VCVCVCVSALDLCTVCGNGVCEAGEPGSGCGDCPAGSLPRACPPAACSGHGACAPLTAACQCFVGYTGADCAECAAGFGPSPYGCTRLPGALVSCADRVRNGNEAGPDCGGPHCRPCVGAEDGRGTSGGPGSLGTGASVGVAVGVLAAVVLAAVAVRSVRQAQRVRQERRTGVAPAAAEGTAGPRCAPALKPPLVQSVTCSHVHSRALVCCRIVQGLVLCGVPFMNWHRGVCAPLLVVPGCGCRIVL
jgi:hypothetical protein